MRFLFLDRNLRLEPGKEGLFLKNVSQSEDFFADHFPGRPIMPGCLILETCDQAARLLLGSGTAFARLPVLERVVNGKFRHFVRPGDALRVHVAVVSRTAASADVRATVSVEGRTVAQASLTYRFVDPVEEAGAAQICAQMREFHDVLATEPLAVSGGA